MSVTHNNVFDSEHSEYAVSAEGAVVGEYTPTTEEVARAVSFHKVVPQREGEDFASWLGRASMEGHMTLVASEAAFYRWLVEHEKQVLATHARTVMNAHRDVTIAALAENRMLGAADALEKLGDALGLQLAGSQTLREVAAMYREEARA